MSVAVQKIDGVASVAVSLNEGLAEIELERGNSLDPESIRDVVRDNGFTPKSADVEVRGRIGRRDGRLVLFVTGAEILLFLTAHPDAPGALDELGTTEEEPEATVTGRLPETAGKPDAAAVRTLQLRAVSRSSPE